MVNNWITRRPGQQSIRIARLRAIANTVMEARSVRIAELAKQFNISLITVHRDLDELQSRGLLRKYRGVVRAQPFTVAVSTGNYTRTERADTDRALALATSHYLTSGQSIVLDDSKTVRHIIPFLRPIIPLTVVTNSLTAINELSVLDTITVIAAGGDYDTARDSFSGHMTYGLLQNYHVDLVIMSATAISSNTLYCTSSKTVEVKRSMLDAASAKILIADHTTFFSTALHALTTVSEFDHVIVDDHTPSYVLFNISIDTPDLVIAHTT